VSEPSVKERLSAARAAKEAKEKAALEAANIRELETLDLEEKLEATHGPRGVSFELVETVEGPIAVRLGEAILHTRFQASKMTDADIHEYVYPCIVHPSKEKYAEYVSRRPAIGLRCASALATLFGAKARVVEGEF